MQKPIRIQIHKNIYCIPGTNIATKFKCALIEPGPHQPKRKPMT